MPLFSTEKGRPGSQVTYIDYNSGLMPRAETLLLRQRSLVKYAHDKNPVLPAAIEDHMLCLFKTPQPEADSRARTPEEGAGRKPFAAVPYLADVCSCLSFTPCTKCVLGNVLQVCFGTW